MLKKESILEKCAKGGALRNILCSLVSGMMVIGMDGAPPQAVSTKVTITNDVYVTDSGLLPLPDKAVELEKAASVGSEHFRSVLKLSADSEGGFYAFSSRSDMVFKFDASGRIGLTSKIKRKKRFYFETGCFAVLGPEQFILNDPVRKTLEFYDARGEHLRSLGIPRINGFTVGADGRLYLAPVAETTDTPLVEVYSAAGKERSFGKPLMIRQGTALLNERSIAANGRGEVFVAFTYFPLVRKYSPEGELLGEFRIESPVLEIKEKNNLKIIAGNADELDRQAGLKPITDDIRASGDRIYLLGSIPRLEITELDGAGATQGTYWMDPREIYTAHDFLVRDADGEKTFLISRSSVPPFEIDVLKKRAKTNAGPSPEIDALTDEITSNPGYAPAYINRGAARYRIGDYQGALEDFTKAIALAPDSAIAYNNRGLARVKSGDYLGAIGDFTKAIELDPRVAAVFFNRGIARAHHREFARAIEDFQAAFKIDPAFEAKAREQIEYCRARVKTLF